MDLNQLTQFIDDGKNEFEKAIRDKAKKLSLSGIIREVRFDTWPFVDKNWEDGQRIELMLSQGHYMVIIDKDSLVLRGIYGIELANFKGNSVERYYKRLSRTILTAIKEYNTDLPF